MTIRNLFDPSRKIDRRIEKVITYDSTDASLLRQEIVEYIATQSIEASFERLLDLLDAGMGGAHSEIGIWVSGFYGSGKSSLTKYLGFALDPDRQIEGKPFLTWLQNQFTSKQLRARLATVAQKHPSAVVMLDLASEQLAGATMAEISSVLYSKVMQWAGYARDRKIAYLEFMLERDGRMKEFAERVPKLANGKTWESIHNQPLVAKTVASKLAVEFYPALWPDAKTFNEITIDEAEKEDDRVREMLDLIRRRSGKENVLFVLDEVGQYVAARDNLILNLDGLAKNIKNIGRGHAWLIATAQQTLTEDDPGAHMNSAKLFKLKDRFPIPIDLEASDIKEICYRRLLTKSTMGEQELQKLFDKHGPSLQFATRLENTRYYKANLDKKTFCDLYPFLPQHFDILLQLLGRLAKTSGGIGLRSGIKVIQDVLVDPAGLRAGAQLLADRPVGALATTVTFYDTLWKDIERSFRHIIAGVEKAEKTFGADSIHAQVAKSISVLQVLEDFPVTAENLAALMHSSVDSVSLLPQVKTAVEDLLKEPSVPLSEVDGSLRFMSEAVSALEVERNKIVPRAADARRILNSRLEAVFTPMPSTKMHGVRTVNTGLKVYAGAQAVSLAGEKDEIQTHIEFVPEAEYERRREERILESQQRSSRNIVFLMGREDPGIDSLLLDIFRCQEIQKQSRSKAADKEVDEYLRSQSQRGENLGNELERRLKKCLVGGSFVFRGQPTAVRELSEDLLDATRKHLVEVAQAVFEKYGEAPIQADSDLAERFLKTEQLNRIASKDDPLTLIKKSGASMKVDTDHKAILTIKNYLEQYGQADGRKLMDDFYAAPCGWSKDTTRYLVAAMLVAGEIKLRVSGEDVTVRGDVAVNALKNTNSFNKVGVALRDGKPPAEVKLRAAERLLELTADNVLPLEEEISKCVIKRFPDLQQSYAALATQLSNLTLPGEERAQSIQERIAEILKGDASDATSRLGGETNPLFDDLLWAREVKKAFDNGMGELTRKINDLLTEIPALPAIGIPGQLISNSQATREELKELMTHSTFYQDLPGLRSRLMTVETQVRNAAQGFAMEQSQGLETQKSRLQNLPEWARLGLEDKARIGAELDSLKVEASSDLRGLKKLVGNTYLLKTELDRIEQEIHELGKPKIKEEEKEFVTTVDVELPQMIASETDLDQLIQKLQDLKTKLEPGKKLKINWS